MDCVLAAEGRGLAGAVAFEELEVALGAAGAVGAFGL